MTHKILLFRKRVAVLAALFLSISVLAAPRADLYAAQETETVNIACVGDSITYGYTSSNASIHSYPSQLQNLLGDGYEVNNYGKTGYTLMKSGDKSYWNTTEYTNSLNSNPDIVILMLGTNDSKAANWADKDSFLSDLEEMIQSYQELSSSPTVYVCTSPRMPQDYEYMDTQSGLDNAVINEEIVPLQKQAAEEMECILIDVNAFSQEGLSDDDFYDYCHPTDVGYQKLANFIYASLTGLDVSMEILEDSESYEDGSGFTFTGDSWVTGTLTSGSINGGSGTEHYADVTEDDAASHSYEITFTGTRIQVYGHLSPNHGIVTYSVDGGEETSVDAYAASRSVNTLLYQASGLSDGVHTLRATATGQKNAAAQNACIQVDYAKIFTEISESDTPGETGTETETETETSMQPETPDETETENSPQSETSAAAETAATASSETYAYSDTKTAETSSSEQTASDAQSSPTASLSRPVLKLRKSGQKVKLTWQTDANADGYIIQMKTGNGKYKKIAVKKGKTASFTKKKLKKNTVYRFRIRSYQQSGSSRTYSAWSKVKKIRL